jgi:hypothetical protein
MVVDLLTQFCFTIFKATLVTSYIPKKVVPAPLIKSNMQFKIMRYFLVVDSCNSGRGQGDNGAAQFGAPYIQDSRQYEHGP